MREIQLSQGKVAIVDDEDFDKANQFKWSAALMNGIWYAYRREFQSEKSWKNVYLHTFITNFKMTDHKSGNGLDNRRDNLRECTRSQNQMNQKKRTGPLTSKYKGVSFMKRAANSPSPWSCTLSKEGNIMFCRSFHTEIEAAEAYNKQALIHHGEFARLNIITT